MLCFHFLSIHPHPMSASILACTLSKSFSRFYLKLDILGLPSPTSAVTSKNNILSITPQTFSGPDYILTRLSAPKTWNFPDTNILQDRVYILCVCNYSLWLKRNVHSSVFQVWLWLWNTSLEHYSEPMYIQNFSMDNLQEKNSSAVRMTLA